MDAGGPVSRPCAGITPQSFGSNTLLRVLPPGPSLLTPDPKAPCKMKNKVRRDMTDPGVYDLLRGQPEVIKIFYFDKFLVLVKCYVGSPGSRRGFVPRVGTETPPRKSRSVRRTVNVGFADYLDDSLCDMDRPVFQVR